jgi:uncharacterized membrane protein YtjA (UPF0391 family)
MIMEKMECRYENRRFGKNTAKVSPHSRQQFVFTNKICRALPITLWHTFITVYEWIKTNDMLRWTLTFLIIAIIAAIFGFGGIASGAAEIAKIIFYIFLVFLVISLIAGAFRRVD